VLIVDIAPCDCDVEVFIEEEFRNHLLRLGSYSPMFHSIKNVWSSLMAAVKQDLCTKSPQILADEDRAITTQTQFHLYHLENIIYQNTEVINATNCAKYVTHVQNSYQMSDSVDLVK